MIYFIQAGKNGPIKIGQSNDPEVRLKNFQTGHYEELNLLFTITSDKLSDRDIHEILYEYRIRGEWFKPEVLNKIKLKDKLRL